MRITTYRNSSPPTTRELIRFLLVKKVSPNFPGVFRESLMYFSIGHCSPKERKSLCRQSWAISATARNWQSSLIRRRSRGGKPCPAYPEILKDRHKSDSSKQLRSWACRLAAMNARSKMGWKPKVEVWEEAKRWTLLPLSRSGTRHRER